MRKERKERRTVNDKGTTWQACAAWSRMEEKMNKDSRSSDTVQVCNKEMQTLSRCACVVPRSSA